VYWAADRAEFVDEAGIRIDPGELSSDRGWIEVNVDARLVGAIHYDARMIGDPRPVRRAGEVLAIAIDRERLTAELLASNDALTRSRVRLVEAAHRERTRIARDLHDGLQVQLVLLALEAQTIADDPATPAAASAASRQLRIGIDKAAADVRRLVHNVLPATLLEQGLGPATEDLVDRLEVPASFRAELDESTLSSATKHTAYFVVAEALSNTVKHSQASTVAVRMRQDDGRLRIRVQDDGVGGASLDDGSGLRGLLDRVDVLGGTLTIDSTPAGTRLEVELPCA
jgi:signal transduction histidine kinase